MGLVGLVGPETSRYTPHPNIFGLGISLSPAHPNISGLKHEKRAVASHKNDLEGEEYNRGILCWLMNR